MSLTDGAALSTPDRRRRSADDLSVRTKILTAVVVAVLSAVVVGLLGMRSLSTTADNAHHLYASRMLSSKAIGQVNATLDTAQIHAMSQLISADADEKADMVTAFQQDQQDFTASVAAYRDSGPVGDPAVIADLQTNWDTFVKAVQNQLIPIGQRSDTKAWEPLRDTAITPVITKANQDADVLMAAESAAAATSAASAQSEYRTSRLRSIVVLTLGTVLALGLGLIVARRIVQSLSRVKNVCDGLAAGDLTRNSGLTSRDEPGQMGRALDAAMGRLRHTISTIDGSAASLANSSQQMSSVTTEIATSAHETSVQAETVSTAAEQISRSVETVSAGSEEMGASINEISQNTSEAARVAAEAVSITAATATTMNKLGDSSAEIGNVIKVITSIAEQTNLLALNATIEAARAGEAGKGFAVVASEVKDLAQETARATEDISRRVEAIQVDTTGAVAAIDEITRVIARISDFQTTIASAVEEQTATTTEMSRSVTEAAAGTSEIARNITSVAAAARTTNDGVTRSRQTTTELARTSNELQQLVSNFRY